jgi:hypothetical protein
VIAVVPCFNVKLVLIVDGSITIQVSSNRFIKCNTCRITIDLEVTVGATIVPVVLTYSLGKRVLSRFVTAAETVAV